MLCPRCNYVMSDFDVEYPRCAKRKRELDVEQRFAEEQAARRAAHERQHPPSSTKPTFRCQKCGRALADAMSICPTCYPTSQRNIQTSSMRQSAPTQAAPQTSPVAPPPTRQPAQHDNIVVASDMVVNTAIGKTCPYCQTPIKPGVQVKICSKCGMPHHIECWQENKGCTTFGCSESPQVGVTGVAPVPSLAPTTPQQPYPAQSAYPQQASPSQQYAPPYQGWMTAPLPPHLNTWNWGAFGCSLLWAGAMNCWGWFVAILLTSFIPFAGLIIAIILGIQGNQLAWTSRRWTSVEHFETVQNIWKVWGIVLTVLSAFILLISIMGTLSGTPGDY